MKRLNAVGASIESENRNKMLGDVMEHLRSHPDEVEPCHRLLKSGMMIHVGSPKHAGNMIPECTTKLGLASQGLRKRVIMHLRPSLDMTTQSKMKAADKKYQDKLFWFALAEEADTAVTDKSEADFFATCAKRHLVCGSRLENIRLKEDHSTDWGECGVYRLVAPTSSTGCFSHVEHVFSGEKACCICNCTQ